MGQAVAPVSAEDVREVGGRQFGQLVVDGSSLVDVGTFGADVHLAGIEVGRMGSDVIFCYQDDVFVIVSLAFQQLVEGQRIGLVTILVP